MRMSVSQANSPSFIVVCHSIQIITIIAIDAWLSLPICVREHFVKKYSITRIHSRKVLSTLFAIIQKIIILYNLWRIIFFFRFSFLHFLFSVLRGVSVFALQNVKMEHTAREYVCKEAQHCPTDRLTKEPLWKRQKPSTNDWISFLLPLFSPTLRIFFSSCFLTTLRTFLRSGFSFSKGQATDKQPNMNTHIHTQIHSNQCAMQLCL